MNHLRIGLIVFSFIGLTALFQKPVRAQADIDSLIKVRAFANHDTIRVNTDLLIGSQISRSDLDSSLFYFERALATSRQELKGFPAFEAHVLRTMADAYRSNQNELCFELYQQAMDVYAGLGLKEELALTQWEMARTYKNKSDFEEAIEQYEALIERNLQDGTEYKMVTAYNSTGLLYYYLRKLDKASKVLLEGIRYVKTTPDTVDLRAFYMNYGLVLEQQERLELAKQYLHRALKINDAINNKRSVALSYTNIGNILIKQDSLDAAYASLTKGWEINKEISRNTWPTADYYKNLGRIAYLRGNYQEAHDYLVVSVANLPNGVAPQSRGDIYGSLVEQKLILADSVFTNDPARQMQLYQEALPYAIEGWELAELSGAGNVRYRLAWDQALLYARLQDFEKAFKFSQLAMEISDDINDKERSEAIARMSAEFETERIESQNTLLRETQRAQSAQIKQQNVLIYAAVVGLILILVIATIIYRSRLSLKNANLAIEQSLSEKKLLLKEIHHRVKNNLQVVSSLLDLQSRGIEDEGALATFMEGQNRVKAMALIHQKLYQNEDLATIDFAEYAENLMKELSGIYPSANTVKSTVKAEGTTAFDIDTAVPLGLILNELISNACKYAFEQGQTGELAVHMESLGEGKHQLTVTDTGGGLPDGFDVAKARSLGLRLVRRLAQQLYGSVAYSYDKGAKFVIVFTDTVHRRAV